MSEKFKNWLQSQLIPDWRNAWKFLSVRAEAIYAAVLVAWFSLPPDQQLMILSAIPFVGGKALLVVVVIAFLAKVGARLKAQPALEKKDA